MSIALLPPAPSPTRPETFEDEGDALLSALPPFVVELNAAIEVINAGSAQAEAALAAVNCPVWISGTAYSAGQCVYSPITHYSYRRKIAGAGTTDPSSDAPNWQKLNSGIASVKTINGVAMEGSGDVAVQPPLVSGTNIKTINGASVLGSGDIVVETIPFGAF